jgi:outer membrane protein OmpA-like peptidoglycan-associated protein
MLKRNVATRYCLLAVGITVLMSCTTLDPYTQEKKMSNASKGAAIGALSGVAVGLITGDNSAQRKKNALILAGVGGLAGGGVGYYMDQQEMKLRQQLEGTGVSVTRIGDNITLNMPGNVTFALNRGDISFSFYQVLDSVGIVLEEFDQTFVEVAGHTDSTGPSEYNQALSERRAQSVAAYLKSRPVRADRLVTVGAGENRPIASNATPEGQALNRRVEITIVPVTS